MAHFLFIRANETQLKNADVSGAEWVLVDKNEPRQMLSNGTVSEPPMLGMGDKTIICVPATQLMHIQLMLPGGNIQRLRKLIPFAVEEYLVEDVQSYHFSIVANKNNPLTAVSVVQRDAIKSWIDCIEAHSLSPTIMVPDCLCIPYHENSWTVFVEDNIALVRTSLDCGFSCELDNLVILLAQYANDELVEQAETLQLYNVPNQLQQKIANIKFEQDVSLSTFDVSGNPLMFLMEQYSENTTAINLMQGEFSRRQKMGQHVRPWIPAAALFASWLVFSLLLDIVHYRQLSNTIDRINQQQVRIFKTAFPQATKFNSPKIQMESRLKAIRKRAGHSENSAPKMLSLAARILRDNKIIGVKSARYREGRLDIDMVLKDLQSLDTVKAKLSNNGLWTVEVLSATSRNNKVESRIQIRGQGI